MPTPIALDHPSLARWRDLLLKVHRWAEPRGRRMWLVGGTVRDILLGRPVVDLDLVTSRDDFSAEAEYLRRALRAALVPLDPEFPTVRLVPRESDGHLDLSGLQGDSLETDLLRRDFTINAMALDLAELVPGTATPIAVSGGPEDLAAGVIRPVSPLVFQDDPLRLLRGPRFAWSLGFHMLPATAALIAREAPLLARTSRERCVEELFKLLLTPQVRSVVEQLLTLGLLCPALGLPAGSVPAAVVEAAGRLERLWLATGEDDPRLRSLAVLALVLRHDDAMLPSGVLVENLRLSARDARFVAEFARAARLSGLDANLPERIWWDEWFWSWGDRALAGLAVRLSAHPRPEIGPDRHWLDEAHALWETRYGGIVATQPPIGGRELIQGLGLTPGPEFGGLLRELHWHWFTGRYESRQDGMELARRLIGGDEPRINVAPFGGVALATARS